jgi:predicted acylesterase/phospholipase RssA
MAKRIAITIAGAVSLGSYEAGVLYELMEAVRTNNEAATSDEQKIYVDVITGASAGGMTAAMVSQRLMYDGKSLQGEFTNSLYQAWVERISLLGLARMQRSERKWHSLFSSDLIDRIGEEMLVKSMKEPGSGPHAAVELVNGVPETLRVGLALTNLDGIDYMIPISGSDGGGFNYTSSLDQKTFEVTPGGKANAKQWREVCGAAVGSGAFPAAFRPKTIDHSVEEYGDRLPRDPKLWEPGKTYVDWRWKDPSAPFPHSDGGVLQNQPLGIAKNLVDEAVASRAARLGQATNCDSSDRLYVFVSPNAVKSTAENLHADRITIWAEMKHLVSVYMRQAMFHDWITAEDMNQKIRVLDTRASELGDVIIEGRVDVPSLAKAAADLNGLLMADKAPARLARLREQYSQKYDAVLAAAGEAAAEAFVGAIATLEAAGQLENRDRMKIVAVVADAQKELAGAGLSAFAGFFKKSFREHDYWVGRVKTRAYLQRADVKSILGVTEWPEEESWIRQPLANPSGVTLPLSGWELARAAFVPGVIMVLIRPVLLVLFLIALLLIGGGIRGLIWWLMHR